MITAKSRSIENTYEDSDRFFGSGFLLGGVCMTGSWCCWSFFGIIRPLYTINVLPYLHMEYLRNKKAGLNFTLEDTIETGIQLIGTEVKSVKAQHGSLNGSHVTI